jgi:FixJ family two-component response regulator
MRAGAFDVLEKSVSPSKLFDAIVAATQIDLLRESHRRRLIELLEAFRSLTARQRVILKHLLDGKVNKWIYTELEISRRTLDLDRAAIMTRFQTSNFLVVARNVLELELQFESLGKELPWETDEMSTPAKLPSMSADYPPADKSTTAELA